MSNYISVVLSIDFYRYKNAFFISFSIEAFVHREFFTEKFTPPLHTVVFWIREGLVWGRYLPKTQW